MNTDVSSPPDVREEHDENEKSSYIDPPTDETPLSSADPEDEPPVLSAPPSQHSASGLNQLLTLFHNNLLLKTRTWGHTFLELFSPVLMMIILTVAYNLSDVLYRDGEVYSSLELDVPGVWVAVFGGLLTRGAGFGNGRKLRVMEEEDVLDDVLGQLDLLKPLKDLGAPFLYPIHNRTHEKIQERRRQQIAGVDQQIAGVDSLDRVLMLQKELNNILKGPLPVPSLSQYMTLSKFISSTLSPSDFDELLSDFNFGRKWGNLVTLGTLHLSPKNDPNIAQFLTFLNTTYPVSYQSLTIREHDSEATALDYIDDNSLIERTWALLDFEESPTFSIRMNYTTLPNTARVVNFLAVGLSKRYQRYYLSGFLTLQRTLNEYMLFEKNCTSPPSTWSFPMPTPSYSQNAFYPAVGFLMGLILAMAFLYPVSRLVKLLVEEKETKMKQTLMIMGVRPWAHLWSWILTALLTFFFISILMTLTVTSRVFGFSNPWLILALMVSFSTATVSFCFFLSAFFSRAKLAAIVGPIALFVTLLPRWIFFTTNRYEAPTAKIFASILPCTALAFATDIVGDYEYTEIGLQVYNANVGKYSFVTSIVCLVFDTVFYMVLGVYLEGVLPSQFGVRKGWCFCLPRCLSSLFGKRENEEPSTPPGNGESDNDDADNPDMEAPPLHSPPTIRILNLTKHYKKSPIPAVCDLSLSLHSSQITCLLGHNGAGKTTTISILTGLIPPTSGTCLVHDHDIRTEMQKCRKRTGICPQHNVLFDDLTVREHLVLFERLKVGWGNIEKEDLIRSRASEVGLEDKLSSRSKTLSGGTKRKLSVAIALSGDPEFVLLDEPTTGMDPFSRRKIWDLLRKKKEGRAVLLTTHFMDEAEILADRIAVMKEGRLQCVGSAMFLKRRFGLGYNLRVVLDNNGGDGNATITDGGGDDADTENGTRTVISSPSNTKNVLSFLQKHISSTEQIRQSGMEVTFRFPPGSQTKFPDLFDDFEKERRHGGSLSNVCGYGVANTTLGEVFLLLSEQNQKNQEDGGEAVENYEVIEDNYEVIEDNYEVIEDNYEVIETGVVPPNNNDNNSKTKPVQEDINTGIITPIDLSSSSSSSSSNDTPNQITKQNQPTHQNTPTPISTFQQTRILFHKRLLNQKRDLKGAFFTVVLPAILIAIIFLILKLDTGITGPPLDLSAGLYTSSKKKTTFGTQVLVGGGGDWNETSPSVQDFRTALATQYPNAKCEVFKGGKSDLPVSSHNVSEFLFETIHNRDHASRYGAFVLNDGIQMDIRVDWDTSVQALKNLYGSGDATLPPEILGPLDTIEEIAKNITLILDDNIVQDIMAIADVDIGDPQEWIELIGKVAKILTDPVLPLEDGVTEDIRNIIMEGLNLTTVTLDQGALGAIIEDGVIEDIRNIIMEGLDLTTVTLDEDVLGVIIEIISGLLETNDPVNLEELINQVSGLGNITTALDGIINYIDFDNSTTWIELGLQLLQLGANTTLDDASLNFLLSKLPTGQIEYNATINSDMTIIHNATSPHAIAAFNQAHMEYKYKQCTADYSAKLNVVNHPLPLTTKQAVEVKVILSILASIFSLIPFCYVPASFIVFVVKERICKSKHLQLVSGVDMAAYWISTYLFDLMMYAILTVLVMIVLVAYGSESAVVFVGDAASFSCTALMIFGYGISILPFSYLLSRSFENHSSAQIAILAIIFITGFGAVCVYFVMQSIERTAYIADALRPLFRLWPAYNLGDGFIRLSESYFLREYAGEDIEVFDWDACRWNILFLYGLSIPYFVLLILLECSSDGGSGGIVGRCLRGVRESYDWFMLRLNGVKRTASGNLILEDGLDLMSDESAESTIDEDHDVAIERANVLSHSKELQYSASVFISQLWKVYPPPTSILTTCFRSIRNSCCPGRNTEPVDSSSLPKRAVRGLSTAVLNGEVYGLLGVNGAGKTTTLSILTGDARPTGGDAYVAGHDVTGRTLGGVSAARKCIGFCPQVDPLLDKMTARETLVMFGKLRGIPADKLDATVDDLINALTLTPHADKTAGSYSGGNKRKLSLGIAIIGDPDVLFIDEASSGMDPVAARKMWELIANIAKRRSVVLTTHSMEEAEALCTRVAIMTGGRMRCLGSVQHLKSTFLDGYTIDVQCESTASSNFVDSAEAHILGVLLVGCTLAERHGQYLKFDIPRMSNNKDGLGSTFRKLELMKSDPVFMVEDYSISQCTLEQVFISLAKTEADHRHQQEIR